MTGGEFMVCGGGTGAVGWVGEGCQRDSTLPAWLSITMHCWRTTRLSLLHRFLSLRLQISANEWHLDPVSLNGYHFYAVGNFFNKQKNFPRTEAYHHYGNLFIHYWISTSNFSFFSAKHDSCDICQICLSVGLSAGLYRWISVCVLCKRCALILKEILGILLKVGVLCTSVSEYIKTTDTNNNNNNNNNNNIHICIAP